MFNRIRTEAIFTFAAMMGLLSIAFLFTEFQLRYTLMLLVPTFGFIIWTLIKSETEGFIKINRMPRAGDPQREFHPVQSLILTLITIIQVALSSYLILTVNTSQL